MACPVGSALMGTSGAGGSAALRLLDSGLKEGTNAGHLAG